MAPFTWSFECFSTDKVLIGVDNREFSCRQKSKPVGVLSVDHRANIKGNVG